jgi:hypothetical protein
MSFSVGSLTNYVKENSEKMLAAQIVAPKTAALIAQGGNIVTGIKTSEKMGIMETDAVFQALTGCGFNASGTTTITQRSLTVGGIKVEEAICPRDLEAKYTQLMLVNGSHYEQGDFSFEKWWADRKVAQIGAALEAAIWKGDSASGDAQLSKFDGLSKLIVAASDEVDANTSTYYGTPLTVAGGGVTVSNVANIIDAIFKAGIATNSSNIFSDDFHIFCGQDTLGLLKLAIRASNYFHYTADAPDTVSMPGTAVKVVGVPGLNGTSDLFGMRLSNMYIGTDGQNEEERPKIWYSQDDDNIKYSNKFKYGVNVGITSEVIKFKVD